MRKRGSVGRRARKRVPLARVTCTQIKLITIATDAPTITHCQGLWEWIADQGRCQNGLRAAELNLGHSQDRRPRGPPSRIESDQIEKLAMKHNEWWRKILYYIIKRDICITHLRARNIKLYMKTRSVWAGLEQLSIHHDRGQKRIFHVVRSESRTCRKPLS